MRRDRRHRRRYPTGLVPNIANKKERRSSWRKEKNRSGLIRNNSDPENEKFV